MQDYTKFRRNLNKVKKEKGWNNKDLGFWSNTSEQVISNWLTGRTPEPPVHSVKLLCQNAGIGYAWLMGDDSATQYVAEPKTHPSEYHIKAKAGPPPPPSHSGTNSKAYLFGIVAEIFQDLPEGEYSSFIVEGNSMLRTLHEGDRLVCSKTTVDKIQNGRVYVLVIEDKELSEYRPSGIWVKRVEHRKENGYLTCKSDNRESQEDYMTFRVKTEKVKEIWYIVRNVTGFLTDPYRDIYEKLDDHESRIELLEQLLNE